MSETYDRILTELEACKSEKSKSRAYDRAERCVHEIEKAHISFKEKYQLFLVYVEILRQFG